MISDAIENLYREVNRASLCMTALKRIPNIEIYIFNKDGSLYDMFGEESSVNRKVDDSFSISKIEDKIIAYRKVF